CNQLSYVTCLATNLSGEHCTTNWLNAVGSSGTFVKAASMDDWTSGRNGIPEGWTVQNDGQ
ncbi:MAG: hypothetical protein J6X20_02145, partial [Bacteroidales bacterium]|nr:hypothetical protein [Bacteroidales bacterium]